MDVERVNNVDCIRLSPRCGCAAGFHLWQRAPFRPKRVEDRSPVAVPGSPTLSDSLEAGRGDARTEEIVAQLSKKAANCERWVERLGAMDGAEELAAKSRREAGIYREAIARLTAARSSGETVSGDARVRGVTWLLIRDGKILLERCPKKREVLGVGEWFVPGGKMETGDKDSLSAMVRELREEWGVFPSAAFALPILAGSPIPPGPRGLFLMQPFAIDLTDDNVMDIPPRSLDGVELRWFSVAEALASPVPQVRMMVAAALDAALPSSVSEETKP